MGLIIEIRIQFATIQDPPTPRTPTLFNVEGPHFYSSLEMFQPRNKLNIDWESADPT